MAVRKGPGPILRIYRRQRYNALVRRLYWLVGFMESLLDKPPRSFSQKVRARMYFDRRLILRAMVDKVAVRSLVAERVGEWLLIPHLFVGSEPSHINWGELPPNFIAKVNHGSGGAILVWDGAPSSNRLPENPKMHAWDRLFIRPEHFDPRLAENLLRFWLSLDYPDWNPWEWAYKGLPAKVMIEPLLLEDDGSLPSDFKFFIFEGVLEMYSIERWVGTEQVRVGFNPDDTLFSHEGNRPKAFRQPANLNELKAHAIDLAQGFDFVRVDLYSQHGKAWFGELTVYPAGGRSGLSSASPYEKLGQSWRPHRGE